MLRMVKKHSGQCSARVVSLAPRGEDKEAIVLRGYDYAWAGRETQWDLRKLHSEKRFQGVGYICFLLQLIVLGLILGLRADHQTRRARRASSAHADVCTLGMSAVSPLLRGSVSAVEAHWLHHNILFGQMHQTYTLHFAKPLQYHTEYLRPQMLSVFSRRLAFFSIQLASALVHVGTRSTTEPTTNKFVRGLHKSRNPRFLRFESSFKLFEAIREIINLIKTAHFSLSNLH